MRPKRIKPATVKNKLITLSGGLNEHVSSLELKGGELIQCLNYQITEGSEGGYVSVQGYERYDGQEAPSSVFATEEDDTARESARDAIGEVPGSGAILGIHIFKGVLYAFRNHTDNLSAKMYHESASGWVEVDTSSVTLNPDGAYHFVNYNFSATTLSNSMMWTDGVSKAHLYDGTSIVELDNTGMDPNDIPVNLTAKDNRLFLAYTTGSLQYSGLGDPEDWTSSGAGEIGIGGEITNLVTGVGNSLVIYSENSIKILTGNTTDTWILDEYSNTSGARESTAYRLLGTIFYLDDRGVTSLEAVDTFGDFEASSISQKVKKTLLKNLGKVTTATVSRSLNQYRLYFDEGTSMYFSFLDKTLQGITTVKYPIPVKVTTEGEDISGKSKLFFGSEGGYVYQMESGTSFDGEAINTVMTTPFYHYNTPRNWKRFISAVFEITGESVVDFLFRCSFDYSAPEIPKGISMSFETPQAGAVYGESEWGSAVYGGPTETNRIVQYIEGIGSNMSISLRTSEAYAEAHTVQNVIVDLSVQGRQM